MIQMDLVWAEVHDISLVRVYTVTDVCIHNPEQINNCQGISQEAHYCMLLFQQYGLVLVNMCHLEFEHFKTFNFYDVSDGDQYFQVHVGLAILCFK
jgi:hypothetical protein